MATASLEPVEQEPSEVNTKSHPHFVDVHKDKLTVTYIGKGSHTDYGSVQSNTHAPPSKLVYYFEVLIVDPGARGAITIGLSDKSFLLNRQPGWEQNSYGYRGEDGKKFVGSSRGESYGPAYGKGDIIGVGIHFLQQYVFFTRNGVNLGKAGSLGPSPEYYPTVGLHSPGESVKFVFDPAQFAFDYEGFVNQQRSEEQQAISREDFGSTDVPFLVVRDYLVHCGFDKTLSAFDKVTGSAYSSEGQADANAQAQADAAAAAASKAAEKSADCGAPKQPPPESKAVSPPVGKGGKGIPPPPVDKGGYSPGGKGKAKGDFSPGGKGKPHSKANEKDPFAGLAWTDAGRERLLESVEKRNQMRQIIHDGEIQKAISVLQKDYPSIIERKGPAIVMLFTQQMIELLRDGDTSGALKWLREELSKLREPPSQTPPAVSSPSLSLTETAALLAYKDPKNSELGKLHFDMSRRHLVGEMVNQEIITYGLGLPPWCSLHLLLRHLVICRKMFHTRNLERGPIISPRLLCYSWQRSSEKMRAGKATPIGSVSPIMANRQQKAHLD